MRSDASSLLKRLSQEQFAYREFPDPIADLELWPIFEALLTDLRVVQDPISRVEEREVEFQKASKSNQMSQSAPVRTGGTAPSDLASVFSNYGTPGGEPTPQAAPDKKTEAKGDLRSFFKRLEGGA